MVIFNSHHNKELEDYINSHPMFCKENTQGCTCKSDFFDFLYDDNRLENKFDDVDYAFWIAGSLKCTGYHNKPVDITWERINEFFTFIEPLWQEFHGKPSGFELCNPNNSVVMLTDDEDFVV